MSIFSKSKPHPRPFPERANAFRNAVQAAISQHGVTGRQVIPILEGIIQDERWRDAVSTPLPPNVPKVYSGNVPEPRPSLSDRFKRLIGHGEPGEHDDGLTRLIAGR